MEEKKKLNHLIQFFNQNGPIKEQPAKRFSKKEHGSNPSSESEEEISERFRKCNSRRVDDDDYIDNEDLKDSDEDGNNPPIFLRSKSFTSNKNDSKDGSSDEDRKERPGANANRSILKRPKSMNSRKKDLEDSSSSDDDENKIIKGLKQSILTDNNASESEPEDYYHHYEEIIINDEEEESEQKEIKNVRPPAKKDSKIKVPAVPFPSTSVNKHADKIDNIKEKAVATLETFKNVPLTEASYQGFKKLLMQTKGELKVMKPKNKKQRNKLESALDFTECVMKDLDHEYTNYLKQIRQNSK